MTKWQDSNWRKGFSFGFKLHYRAERLVDILAGIAIGLLVMIWAVYA